MAYTVTQTMLERFEDKYIKRESGCWEWTAGKSLGGYGRFHTPDSYSSNCSDFAHRVSLYLYKGVKVPDGKLALHSCDNPSCVNPDHLRVGTQTDNMREMVAKGRGISPRKRLSDDDKELIVFMRQEGATRLNVASYFNLNVATVSEVCRKDRLTA